MATINNKNNIAESCLYEPLTVSNNNSQYTSERRMENTKKFPQYLAAIAANVGILSVGICMGWTSPVLPKLKGADSPLNAPITPAEESWIGSLITVGAAIGPLYSGALADIIGRKWTLLLSGVPLLIGWILVCVATSIGYIYAARIIWGLAVGQLFTVVPMYVGEIAESSIRGALGSLLQAQIVIGFLIAYAVGPFVSYNAFNIISIVPAVLFLIFFFFMPDSPTYLLSKGKREEASAALQKLRGQSAQGVQEELRQLEISQDQSAGSAKMSDLWTSKGNFKALYLSVGLVVFQQISGINVVLFYMQNIFDKANTGLSGEISTIIIGIVQCLASGVTPFIVEKMGRKLLLMISALGMTVALGLLGLFFILDHYQSPVVSSISWLPILSLVLFMCVYCTGFGPLPWAVMGELFDPSVKSIASTIATTCCWIASFIVTKYFNSLDEALGTHFAFWIFGIFTLIAFFFTLFLLPETKGKSLQEIQNILNGRKTSDAEKS